MLLTEFVVLRCDLLASGIEFDSFKDRTTMQDARNIFKRCLAQTCFDIHAHFSRFAADVGLNDFLLDLADVDRSPEEIATFALDQLIAGDEGLTDRILCLGVVSFLDKTLGLPKEDPDPYLRLKDLAEFLSEEEPSPDQIERWIETWYG